MAAQNLANSKTDLVIALVQKELRERVNLLPTIMDYSQFAVKGAKSIRVPRLSSFTVADRAFGAAASEVALTDAVDEITLDKNKIIHFAIDKADEIQSSLDYQLSALTYAAAAHARQIDTDIIAELKSVASLNINGGTPADITVDNILDMREWLMSKNADMTRVTLVITPDQEKAMLKLAEFSRFEYRGIGPAPVLSGQIGSVYGVPVVINNSPELGEQNALMYEMSGCGIAFQKQPNVGQQPDVRYGSEGILFAVDQLYGVGGLQLGVNDTVAQPVAGTESPLVTKLAN
jgi:hypothetical protein